MKLRSLALLAVGVAALPACGSDGPAQDGTPEAERGAKGEVLGGTISDDMLPLDRLRSQSPPLRAEPAQPGAGGEGATEADPEASESDATAAEEAAPAEGDAAED